MRNGVNLDNAAGRLGATHVLAGAIRKQWDRVHVEATVTDLATRLASGGFSGDLATAQLSTLPVSLAGVVTSSFHLSTVVPARVAAEALPLYLRAVALLRRDNSSYQPTLRLLEEASKLDSSSPLIQASLAEAWLQAFRASRDARWLRLAEDAAYRAQALHPDSVPVLLIRGQLEQATGRPENAMVAYRRATEVQPSNAEVWRHIGGAYRGMSLYTEAVAALQKSIALDDAYYGPHVDLGFTYFRMGRYADAAGEYRMAIAASPELAIAHNYLGALLLSAGKDEEAEKAIRRSIEITPAWDALHNLGIFLIYHRRDPEAIQTFEQALRLGNDAPALRINLADACRRERRREEAASHYQRALEQAQAAVAQNPRDGQARTFLAYSSARLGNATRARFEIAQATQQAPTDSQVLHMAVMTYVALGEREPALRLLESASREVLEDLNRQPDLAQFSLDPRYQQIRARLAL